MKMEKNKVFELIENKDYDRLRHIFVHDELDLSAIQQIVLELKKQKDFFEGYTEVKIAILSSYTCKNIQSALEYELIKHNFDAQIKFGGYNQYFQEIFNEDSFIYEFKPDLIIILLDTSTFFDKMHFSSIDGKTDELSKLMEIKLDYLSNLLETANKKLNAKIILSNLQVPTYSPHGIKDVNLLSGYKHLIPKFNSQLAQITSKMSKVCLLDFESFASGYGKNRLTDHKFYYLGKLMLSEEVLLPFSKEIMKIIGSLYGKSKKCLVVDLDNTLWGGVIGEDGVNGIKIGDESIGLIYKDVQKIILNIYKKGVILAINSKNNESDVFPVFENSNMVLKKEHFSVMKINWNDKAQNIIEIAKELNIGLDSIVFLDDNPAERGLVKQKLPMVYTIDFPEDISELPHMLMHLPCFEFLDLTEEDMKRNEMYSQERKRVELQKNFTNVEEYLFDLGIKMEFKQNSHEDIERITQLINKTNQFNLCTNRYTKEQVDFFLNSKDYKIYSAKVSDKFGDSGLTIVAIVKENSEHYEITDFLMSCRVMNRGIEKEFLRKIMQSLSDKKKSINGIYKPTSKNSPVIDFYDKMGFKKTKQETSGQSFYILEPQKQIEQVKWIL